MGPPQDCKLACVLYGLCGTEATACRAQETDCQNSGYCKEDGRCHAVDGRCQPSSEADCKDSAQCAARAFCGFDGVMCVQDAAGCKASQFCGQHGDCVFADGRCHALATFAFGCTPTSNGCADLGDCADIAGICRPGSDADCRQATACWAAGLCWLVGGKCVASRPAECTFSDGCLSFGRCTLKAGACVAGSAADCAASTFCKSNGACRLVDGICLP